MADPKHPVAPHHPDPYVDEIPHDPGERVSPPEKEAPDWPELDPDQRNDRADDPDTDPGLEKDDGNRPGVPASDPESGA